MDIQVQEAQRTPRKINPKITRRHIIIKMLKVKKKDLFIWERKQVGEGVEEEGDREADSQLSAEPDMGLDLKPWGYNLSQN